MRSQNIKCNLSGKSYFSSGKVGSISCLLLLLFTFLAVNPFASLSAFAEEDEDYKLETYASTPSTVTISFSPSSASGSVTPVDSSNGDKAKVDVKATVNVKNSGGYKVYVGSSSSQLKNGSNVIDSVTSATTYANLPINRWGYSFQEGTTVKDSYTAMPATLRSTALYSNTSTNIADETKTFMLSFVARIGSDKPAGTYSNSVTMSVVSSPREVASTWADITTMQEMTSAICTNAASGASKQLKDTRDGKFYWVSKLADGKCWMTQNLDLDLSTDTKLTSDTSDVPTAGWTPGFTTAEAATSDTVNASSDIETRSWNLGDYRITNPNTPSNCGYPKNLAASCLAQFTFFATPTTANGDVNAHYILGNHYQWNTATAGTGGSITSGEATNSICPKGWRLPTSNVSNEFQALVNALGGNLSTDNVTKAPFYGVRGGDVSQDPNYLFNGAGSEGNYWSSSPRPAAYDAWYFRFFGPTSYSALSDDDYVSTFAPDPEANVDPNHYGNRRYGQSVRCVAR